MRLIADALPKRLYSRALLIMIVPMLLLQCVVAYFFMERHWQSVTFRLSQALVQDIAAVIDLYRGLPSGESTDALERVASNRLGLDVDFLPAPAPAGPPCPSPSCSCSTDRCRARSASRSACPTGSTRWGARTSSRSASSFDSAVLRVIARRSAAYASNSYIFILWMVGTSLVLIVVATAFLRNQIRPILRLAVAAENLGKGRFIEYRPNGATEVRRAGYAFLEMRRRIERAVEQRTTMLNGVSHDLRTVLTRFKLSLELFDDGPDAQAMHRDIDEMGRMLEAYLAFARGDGGETSVLTDMRGLIEELRSDAERHGRAIAVSVTGETGVIVRPDSFKRCLSNLVGNAERYGQRIEILARRDDRFFTINVDDDGPGIPGDKREDVFPPLLPARCGAQPGTRAARAWASPSPGISRARTAATSSSARARWAGCAPPCGCRSDAYRPRPVPSRPERPSATARTAPARPTTPFHPAWP